MKISVVIPTRGDQNMKNIFACLHKQTYKDFEVIFVVDKQLDRLDELAKLCGLDSHLSVQFISNLTHVMPHNNASALRNLGIKVAKGEFIQLMDDDEFFEPDYLEKSLCLWTEYRLLLNKDFVLTPTLMYRTSGRIQNQGFSRFSYLLSRPIPQKLGKKKRDFIQMYSGNSLFAPATIFQEHLFDERFDFIYEDLDFTYSIFRAGFPIVVLRNLKIFHMERDKTKLEQARVANEYAAYRKSKHRMLFVKKHANFFQKVQFYFLGFRGQPAWLMLKILLLAPKKQKMILIRALWKGMFYTRYEKK